MCGIVGYVGTDHAKEKIIDGLKRLEYRGYDSAGIALPINGKIEIRKHVGEIKNLEKIIGDPEFDSSMGIGHTRWATHGVPSDLNAHPHGNEDNSIAIVHNGIIENYQELKEWLANEKGVHFKSETDSEVIAHLIGVFYEGDLHEAVNKAVAEMRGAYAICAIAAAEPDKIVAVRKDAPLVAGIGKGFNFIASDIPALLKYVREVYLIENNETVVLTKDDIAIYNDKGQKVKRDVFHVTWDADAAEKEGYEHFMLKEIHEQPKGIFETLNRRLNDDGSINLDGISMTKEDIENFNKVYIVACGTAYHAGLVGKMVIEKMARVPVEVDVASEFRYRDPFVDENTLFIAICSKCSRQLGSERIRRCILYMGRSGDRGSFYKGIYDTAHLHVPDRTLYGKHEGHYRKGLLRQGTRRAKAAAGQGRSSARTGRRDSGTGKEILQQGAGLLHRKRSRFGRVI